MLDGPNSSGEGWDKNSPLRYVAQVMRKLADGTYPTEETKCFCGVEPARDTVITERDRYTIDHRMVMCENCLLIRANPRMTKEAYAEFYNNEYRKIYDGFPYGADSENNEFLFDIAYKRGKDLKEFLAKWDVAPQIVIDIGSDKGGTLMPFKEGGAEVYGVEICEQGRTHAETKGIQSFATIEELIAKGIKADLVIMQDVIEHLTDLREMDEVRHLLAPKGRLFIYTPGLLAVDPHRAFQNAHTFQFIGASLEYVMEMLGYMAEIVDDHVISIWKYIGTPVMEQEIDMAWRKQIIEHLLQTQPRSVPPVRTKCKFSEKDMIANFDKNLALKLPMMRELVGKYSGPCVIVSGGPSVDGQIEKIRELVDGGAALMVIERMYPWCHRHGFKPTFVIQLDATEGVEQGFTHIDPDAIHLIAASTHPSIFKVLEGYKVYIWSGVGGAHPDVQGSYEKNGYDQNIIINTGGSVGLASLTMAEVLGYRDLHVFGLDFMVPSHDKTYAAHVAGESVDRTYVEVEVGEEREKVLTCSSYLAFAQQFFRMTDTARRWGMLDSINVYGESLINKMWIKDGELNPAKSVHN